MTPFYQPKSIFFQEAAEGDTPLLDPPPTPSQVTSAEALLQIACVQIKDI